MIPKTFVHLSLQSLSLSETVVVSNGTGTTVWKSAPAMGVVIEASRSTVSELCTPRAGMWGRASEEDPSAGLDCLPQLWELLEGFLFLFM